MQCIVHCEPITEYFRSQRYKEDINWSNPSGLDARLAISYANLLSSLFNSPPARTHSPSSFKQTLAKYNPDFSGHDQKDVLEFLTTLINGLHEDLNKVKSKSYVERDLAFGHNVSQEQLEVRGREAWDAHKTRNDSFIVDTLHGLLKSTTECGQCRGTAVTFDPFADIIVPLPLHKM